MDRFIILPQGTSSSTLLAQMHAVQTLPSGTTLMLTEQTAGRGQRGNSWEAEPGKNVTMSMLITFDRLPAAQQFIISQIISLTIVDLLREYLAPEVSAERVMVKWPNDIYVDDSKIAGILIENTVCGPCVAHSIIGIGLNVNQLRFLSDAPNPVSMAQLGALGLSAGHVGRELAERINTAFQAFSQGALSPMEVQCRYRAMLWRGDGIYPYTDVATGKEFMGCITDIEPNGMLHLTDEAGTERIYAFKEVVFKV